MTPSEIESIYANALYRGEAFEIFDAERVDNATVATVLGQEAAREYAFWMQANLK